MRRKIVWNKLKKCSKMVENCFRKIMFVVNEMESFCKEYIQLKKIKLRTIIGGFGSLLTDKVDYWRINCFNYWQIMCITDGFESNSVTGGSLALLAEYLIHYTITDGFTSLSKEKACAFTLLADMLHYWRNI